MRVWMTVIALMLFIAGCADSDSTPPLPITHPANVDAAETPYSPEASVLAPERSANTSSTTAPAASTNVGNPAPHQHRSEGGR